MYLVNGFHYFESTGLAEVLEVFLQVMDEVMQKFHRKSHLVVPTILLWKTLDLYFKSNPLNRNLTPLWNPENNSQQVVF